MVIPVRFAVQKEPQQFGLNALTKSYFEQLGFEVFMSDDATPKNVSHCDKLFLDVTGTNNMIRTTLKITITDCNQNVILTTPEFSDRDKSNHIAFSRALRVALKSVGDKGYNYQLPVVNSNTAVGNNTSTTVILSTDFESTILYAQPIQDGFQLVDTTPKVVLRIFNTSCPDVYTAFDGVNSGVLTKVGGRYFFEYLLNDKKVIAELEVRF